MLRTSCPDPCVWVCCSILNDIVALQFDCMPQTLEDSSCSLAYYGIFDGGTIVVHNADDNKKKEDK